VPEVAKVGRTLRTWRQEYLAYLDTGQASNGPTEAINLVVEKIRRAARGYRNWHNYRLRLLLHCGVTWDRVTH
jgi:transposase